MPTDGVFLFSVDLEDVRLLIPDGERYAERVPAATAKYLEYLARARAKTTFFVVGQVAEKYPELIRRIASEGHEIACHTARHIPLDRQDPSSFKADLESNLEAIRRACGVEAKGFRAPTFSLVERTKWAFRVLKELGFEYSSSVLPARNPLYGWPEFGEAPREVDGILEIPMTLANVGPLRVPFGGGVYFRVLPFWLTRRAFRRSAREGKPVLGYFHPYDVDTEQEHFMHPGINESRFYNFLMYYNRISLLPKLERVAAEGFRFITYRDWARELRGRISGEQGAPRNTRPPVPADP